MTTGPRYPHIEVIPPPPIAGDRELLIRAVTTALGRRGASDEDIRAYTSGAESLPGYDAVQRFSRDWVTLTGLPERDA